MRRTRSKSKSRRRPVPVLPILGVCGVLSLGAVTLSGCLGSQPQAAEASTSGPRLVKIEAVAPHKVAEAAERAADIQPSGQFKVASKYSGTIREVLKHRGEFVQQGDVLFQLDSPEVQALVAKAEQDLSDAQTALNTAQNQAARELAGSRVDLQAAIRKSEQHLDDVSRAYNKVRNDFDIRMATQAQLDQAAQEYRNAQDDVAELKRKLSLLDAGSALAGSEEGLKAAEAAKAKAEQAAQELAIKAPISGYLSGAHLLEQGAEVKAGDEIAVVQKLDPVYLKANLSEEEAKLVRGKKELTYVTPDSKTPVSATVAYVADILDPQTKSYELVVQAANPDLRLKPGMQAVLQLTKPEELVALAVPTYSILKEGDSSYVYVDQDGKAEKRKVKLGRVSEPYQEVLDGVREGESVITSGLQQLTDQEPVRTKS